MKHSNNNNNMARAATNPRERLCDTRRKQKAHKSMQHIMGTKYSKLVSTINLLTKTTILYSLHTFRHLKSNLKVTIYFKLSSTMN